MMPQPTQKVSDTLAKAGNAQSVTGAEANPLITPGKTIMLSNDATAHKNGKRHIAALVKAGNA